MKISTDFPLASAYPLSKKFILIQKAWKAIDEQGTLTFPASAIESIEHHSNEGNTIALFRVKLKK